MENLTGERNSWRLPGPRNLRGSWGGAGHARPVLVRDDAVDSAHGAAAEGGDGGDVRVSARSRFRSCARGAAGSRGGRGASPAPRRKRTPTDGAQSSTGGEGICDRTHRPSSRPRPSREKLGNGSIVVMICGGVIDASVARLQPGLRAQTCARGGDQQAGGCPDTSFETGISVPRWSRPTGILGTCGRKERHRGAARGVNRGLTAPEPHQHSKETRSPESEPRVRRAKPYARVPGTPFFHGKNKNPRKTRRSRISKSAPWMRTLFRACV